MTAFSTPKPPKVSICIPAYNQAQYLGIALRSALEQEYEDLEVVVSDNHSTDETAEYLASVRDGRFRVVKPASHLGKAQNFDFCISRSSGQYINVLCSDDRLLPSYARKIAGVLDEHPGVAFAYSAGFIIDEESGTRHIERHVTGSFVRKGDSEIKRFLKNAGCVSPSIMMRRQFYDRAGGFSFRCSSGRDWHEVIDWDLELRLIRCGDIAYYDEPLAEFRVWQRAEWKEKLLRLIEETGWLYDTVATEIVSVRPELEPHFQKVRLRRASTLICGLKRENTTELQKSKPLILRVYDSRFIRLLLLLHGWGLSPIFSMFLVCDRWARRTAKRMITWCKGQIRSAHRAGFDDLAPNNEHAC